MSKRISKHVTWGGHVGENISYKADGGEDTVIRFLIDDGHSTRGHRDNIFNAEYSVMGAGVHDHPTWRNCVVVDYAGSVTPLDDKSTIPKAPKSSKISHEKPKHSTEETKTVSTSSTSHEEPKDYRKKSVHTKTSKKGGKCTVTTTTKYEFKDGSSQTFTETKITTIS